MQTLLAYRYYIYISFYYRLYLAFFSAQTNVKNFINPTQTTADSHLHWNWTVSKREYAVERDREKEREREGEQQWNRKRETLVDIPIVFGLTLITFQLSAAWLSFVYSARDMPWLQLTMCDSPVSDALPSRIPPSSPCSTRCCRVWLPLVTLMSGSTDSTRLGHDLCGPKSENCAQTCCKWTTKKKAKLKRCATTCCIHCTNVASRNTLQHIISNLQLLSQHTQCSSEGNNFVLSTLDPMILRSVVA